jgi:hypothetical protein
MPIEMIESEAVAPATVKTITHTLALPGIGTHWLEEGGIFAGILRGAYGQPDRALIVSPPDAGGEFDPAEWGEYGKDIEGAKSKTDGLANTRAMAGAGNETAAKVLALDIGGKADWYIGSQAEMHIAAANVPDLFDQSDFYWTSTQDSRYYAFVQDFEHGSSLLVQQGHRVPSSCRPHDSTSPLDRLNACGA